MSANGVGPDRRVPGPRRAAGIRVARLCSKCSWRGMGDPQGGCPDHGALVCFTDSNRPYFGRGVVQAPGFDAARYEAGMAARLKVEGR